MIRRGCVWYTLSVTCVLEIMITHSPSLSLSLLTYLEAFTWAQYGGLFQHGELGMCLFANSIIACAS